ncbi:hypothetical protein GCM10028895_27520 [Pontibacter rugosus]
MKNIAAESLKGLCRFSSKWRTVYAFVLRLCYNCYIGYISERKNMQVGVELLHAIQDVYLTNEITLA